MSRTLAQVQEFVAQGRMISDHGYDELAADGIMVGEIVTGVPAAIAIKDYPDFHKGPCVLALQNDADDLPVHAV
jgi:hypothetical protein